MITSYPDKNSLKEVLSTELSVSAIRNMCRNNGVFVLSPNKSDVINTAHLFYWGCKDINRISELMEDAKNYKKSFRLTVEKEENYQAEETEDTFSEFFTLVSSYRNGIARQKGIDFESFVIDRESGQPHLRATAEYRKKRKGRVKLMDESVHRFSFDAYEEDDRIIIDVIFDDRSSVQVAKNMVEESVAPSEAFCTPKQISLCALTTAERVELFDRFFAYQLDDWRIEAVKSIKVQMSENNDHENEEEAAAAEDNFLTGIESALFSGSGLRTNPIVIDAVNKGYFFPKATVMLEHRRDALKLLLDVSFNTDDLVLELSVVTTYEVEDERAYRNPIPPEEQEVALQYFHQVFATIFANLIQERTAE